MASLQRSLRSSVTNGLQVVKRAETSAVQAERKAEIGPKINALHYLHVARALLDAEGQHVVPLAIDLLISGCLRCLRYSAQVNPAADLLLSKGVWLVGLDAFRGNAKAAIAVQLSPDGRLLASLHEDYVLIVWDLPTKQQILRIATHPSCQLFTPRPPSRQGAPLFSFSADSRWFAHEYLSTTPMLLLWTLQDDPECPFKVEVLPASLGGGGGLLVMAFDPKNAAHLALCSNSTGQLILHIIDIVAKDTLSTIPIHTGSSSCVVAMAWALDGTYLAVSIANELHTFGVNTGIVTRLDSWTFTRTGKLLDQSVGAEPRQYPPPMRQWERVTPLGLCFAADYRLGVAFEHSYAFEVDIATLRDSADPRLVPDPEEHYERRDIHLFSLAQICGNSKYRIDSREVWGFAPVGGGNSRLHRIKHPCVKEASGQLFFHPGTTALSLVAPVQGAAIQPYMVYTSHMPSAQGKEEPAVFHLPMTTSIGPASTAGMVPVGLSMGTVLLLDNMQALGENATQLAVFSTSRTAYDSRDWGRKTFLLDRTYHEEMEREVRASKKRARDERLARRTDGEDEEDGAEEEEEEAGEPEVSERRRRAQAKEEKLRALRKQEFGVGWKGRINAQPVVPSSSVQALALFLSHDGQLLFTANSDASLLVHDVATARLVKATDGETGRKAFQGAVLLNDGQLVVFRGTQAVDPVPKDEDTKKDEGDAEEVEEEVELEPPRQPTEEEEEEAEDGEEDAEEVKEMADLRLMPSNDQANGSDPQEESTAPPPAVIQETIQDILCIVDVEHNGRECIYLSDNPATGFSLVSMPDAWLVLPVFLPYHPAAAPDDAVPSQNAEEDEAPADDAEDGRESPVPAAAEEEGAMEHGEENAVNEDDDDDADSDSADSELTPSEHEERSQEAAHAQLRADQEEQRRAERERKLKAKLEQEAQLRHEKEVQAMQEKEAAAAYAQLKKGTLDIHITMLQIKGMRDRAQQRREEVEEDIETEEADDDEEGGKGKAKVPRLDGLEVYSSKRTIILNHWKHLALHVDLQDHLAYQQLLFAFAASAITQPQLLIALASSWNVFLFHEDGEAFMALDLHQQESHGQVQQVLFSGDGTLLAVALQTLVIMCNVSERTVCATWVTPPHSHVQFIGQYLKVATRETISIILDQEVLHHFALPQAHPGVSNAACLESLPLSPSVGRHPTPCPSLLCCVLAGSSGSKGTPMVVNVATQGSSTADALLTGVTSSWKPLNPSPGFSCPTLVESNPPACVVQQLTPVPGPAVVVC